MKKIILILVMFFLITGCSFNKDNLEGADVYTTTYPITYLLENLYGEYADIKSIYPEGADSQNYELTNKQISKYAKSDLFVYNGLTDEKKLAKKFLNKNKKILLIDVSYGLSIKNASEELWLSPNNYLMLAKNIRNNLNEYLENKYIINEVNKNYNKLAEILSLMDADLRSTAKTATQENNNIILASSKIFKYLESYGFIVISLDEDINKTTDAITNIKNNFQNNKYLALIYDNSTDNNLINELINIQKDDTIHLSNLTNESISEDYISIMHEFIHRLQVLVAK